MGNSDVQGAAILARYKADVSAADTDGEALPTGGDGDGAIPHD